MKVIKILMIVSLFSFEIASAEIDTYSYDMATCEFSCVGSDEIYSHTNVNNQTCLATAAITCSSVENIDFYEFGISKVRTEK